MFRFTTRSLALAAGAALAIMPAAALARDAFTVILLPDTQNYVNNASNAPLFTQQTQWIADQILVEGNPRNIVFVSHLGDMVSTGTSLTQFDRADQSMSVLDGTMPEGVIPYAVLPGNHDFAVTGGKSTGTDNFVSFFGPDRFAGRSWFGGAEPSGNNTFQRFTGAGFDFIHISLEWRPTINITNGPTRDPSPIEWAQSVINDNPGIPVIVSTHEYVDDNPPGRSPAGDALWNELIRNNDQIIMVLNGHFHSAPVPTNDGEYHQISANNFGKPVIEVLQDYQDYSNGGDGWLRIVTFDTDANTVRFETFSPVLDQFQTETVEQVGPFASDFTLELDFVNRFDFAGPPEPPVEIFEEIIIAEGLDNYAGTQDKEIRSSGGDETNGQNPEISVDGDDGSPGLQPNQALIRFDNIIGNDANQIPTDIDIEEAFLELNIVNPGSGMTVFQMTADWDENTTWAELGGDGVTPGTEANADPITAVGADNGSSNVGTGTLQLDIAKALQNWLAGDNNLGLALIPFPNGTNGIDFTTSESTNPPRIVVRSLLPGLTKSDFTQGIDAYSGAADTQLTEAEPDTPFAEAVSLSIDADDPSGEMTQNQVLIRFDDLFGDAPDQIAADSNIVRAFITVTGTNPGDGGALHRLLIDWEIDATWNNSFGGNGVQADDVEASAAVDAFVPGATGTVQIEVLEAVKAWQADPASNFGWVIIPAGNDGWDIDSSEAPIATRPTVTIVVADTPTTCTGDINADGLIDALDLGILLGQFGNAPAAEQPADLNDDAIVDALDLGILLGLFGTACNPG